VLDVAVDAEQALPCGRDAHHARSVGVGDLEIAVGQPSGEVHDGAGLTRCARNRVEQRIEVRFEHGRGQLHWGMVEVASNTV
jgi:hypothetical protein